MILLSVMHGKHCIGRCTARCYASRKARLCGCVCGGRNHGVGYERAIENTRRDADKWLKEHRARYGSAVRMTVAPQAEPTLF